MSLSKVSNRWLNRAYKCIAIFLVIFAVLISALRLFLPYAHNYRLDLQNYINNTYESNIIIGSLNMNWQSEGPTLEANNVSILQTKGVEVYIESFDISFDFWKSIREQRFITRDFTLDGVKIFLESNVIDNDEAYEQDNNLLSNVSELFLKQIGRFSVNNSQVIYRKDNKDKTFIISQIDWLNQGEIHQAKGSVILDGLTSNSLQLNLNIEGEHLPDMQGTLYVEAKSVNITPWLDKVLTIDDENTHSSINFDAWLSIENGLAQTLQIELGTNQIAWQHNKSIQTLNIEAGHVLIKNIDKPHSLQLASTDIHVRSNDQLWQPFSVNINRVNDGTQAYVSEVNVAGLIDLLPLMNTEIDTQNQIEGLNAQGNINDIYFDYYNNTFSAVAKFSEVSTQYNQGIPSIENVSGELFFHQNALAITMTAENGELNFDKHFLAPIKYQNISSDIFVHVAENRWNISSPKIQFNSEEINIEAELGVTGKKGQSPELSLFAKATEGNAIYAQTFYPHLLMGEELVNYLNSSLLQGQLEQALVLINGPIDSFPYEDNSGVFVVDAELIGSTFKFDEEWQPITHFDANLNFTNNSMMITGREGLLSGISVAGVKVGIADLEKEQKLLVDASFSDTAPDLVTNLMLTSPFNESVGTVLEQIVINDNISGTFNLNLPLNDLSQAIAQGTIAFDDNSIALQHPEMNFTRVHGSLAFNNDDIHVNGLQTHWRGMPLTIDVKAYGEKEYYQTDIDINASWVEDAWLAQVPEQLKLYGEGQLDWQGQLAIQNYHDGSFSYTMNIDSDLLKAKLNLPEPFNKNLNDENNVKVLVKGNKDQSSIDATVNEQLKFFGNLNHQQVAFTQSHLILGDEEMYLPFSGFHISADLKQANFEQWQPFISDILASLPQTESNTENTTPLFKQPERIRGHVDTLTFLDEEIHDVNINLSDKLAWWLLELSSKEARADVKIFPDWLQQGLEIEADFIHLAPNKLLFAKDSDKESDKDGAKLANKLVDKAIDEEPESVNKTQFDITLNDELFESIPTLKVKCESCSYGNLNIGSTSFDLERPSSDLIKLNNFISKRKNSQLMFDGNWRHNQKESTTSLVGSLNLKDLERELERLSLSTTVKDSGLKSNFDLSWQGSPKDIAFQSLKGDLSAKLNDGYLAEVPDQARAFSILSLQSLVRKLKFDFRDIFSDGMFYSEIKGDFHIQDGILYTKNTFLKGAAGDLSVKGNTNLMSETLDYSMSYKPNLTSSLPAIAWIATLNPVTFLAGIAIDEVITSQVVSEYKIEVTGSISKPNIKEVDRKTQNISVGRDSPPQIVEHLPEELPSQNRAVIDPETGLIDEKVTSNQDDTDG